MKEIFKKESVWILILTVILTTFISFIKYKDDVNYHNADATWHTLLTIEAYNETVISKHLFLPIVSLGKETDKNITWGASIPDKEGNYYYTSFSPVGFFLPWLFFKVFNLSVSESSLYIFNSLLFIISALLWVKIISYIYRKNKYVTVFSLCALLTYICAPEILHGLGIVYWHQSVFQVTFLIQLYSYLKFKENNNDKIAKFIFYGTTLINPYIEWTGYVANVGFGFVELILNWNKSRKEGIKKCLLIGILTACSFVIFCLHYLLVVNAKSFVLALKDRFFSRGISSNQVSFLSLVTGYFTSFKFLWIVLLVLVILNYSKSKKLELNNRIIFLLLLFPLIENILLKEHAVSYSYDRMKLIFPLSLLICEIVRNIVDNYKSKKIVITSILGLMSICCVMNISSYINDDFYVWKESVFYKSNEKLASYINKKYSNSVLSLDTAVRGYINLLFKRGIYEGVPYDSLKDIAESRGTKYFILLFNDFGGKKGSKIKGAVIYDKKGDIVETINIDNNGKITKNKN